MAHRAPRSTVGAEHQEENTVTPFTMLVEAMRRSIAARKIMTAIEHDDWPLDDLTLDALQLHVDSVEAWVQLAGEAQQRRGEGDQGVPGYAPDRAEGQCRMTEHNDVTKMPPEYSPRASDDIATQRLHDVVTHMIRALPESDRVRVLGHGCREIAGYPSDRAGWIRLTIVLLDASEIELGTVHASVFDATSAPGSPN
jgi:hypothetical protein